MPCTSDDGSTSRLRRSNTHTPGGSFRAVDSVGALLLLTPFTLLGRRRQRSRGLVTISSLALLLATTPGASAEAPPSPPPMLPSAVCTTPGGYCLLSSGICSSASLVITTVSECEAAAVALELSDTTATLENQRVYLPPPPPSPPPRSLSPSPPAPSPPSPPPSLPPLPPPSLPPPSPPLCWKFENQFENQFNGTRHSLEEQQIISADQQTIGTRCGAGSIGSLCGGIAMGSDFSLESAAANSMLATAQSLSMVALYPIFTAPKVRAPVAHAPASLHAQRFPRRATLARTAGTPHAKQPPRVLLGAPHPAPPRLALQRAPTPPRLPLHPHHVPRSNPRSHVTLTPRHTLPPCTAQRSGDEPTPRPSKKTLASLAHELFETITFHSHRLLVRGKQPKKVSEARERRALTQASAAGFIPSAVEPALKATPEGSSASHPGVGGLSASPSSASPPSVRPCSTGKRLQGSPCTSLPVGPEGGLEGGPEGGFASQRSERRSCKFEERKPVLNGTELCEVQANKKTAFVSTPYPIFTGPKVRAPVASAPASLHNAPYHWHRLPRPLPLAPPPTPPTTGIASATTGTASATTGTASQGPLPLAPPPLPRSC